MNSPPKKESDSAQYDPVFLHARRETLMIVFLFLIFFLWSILYCYFFGYLSKGEQLETISTVMGIPSWVFWGILFPWVMVDVVAVWFCFFYMKNDDLGEAHEGEDLTEQVDDHQEHHHE